MSRKKDEEAPGAAEEPRAAGSRGRARVRHRHQVRHRSRSPRDQSPRVKRHLVAHLRSVCEDIDDDVTQIRLQQAQTPLTWEQLAYLSQVRTYLSSTYHTLYTMAMQAAYAFPAPDWLMPNPLPGTGDHAQPAIPGRNQRSTLSQDNHSRDNQRSK